MLSCQDLPVFSARQCKKRMEKATRTLGTAVVIRIIAFALYLLGARRIPLAGFVHMAPDTVKSLMTRLLSDGLPALEDRRRAGAIVVQSEPEPVEEKQVELGIEGKNLVVDFDSHGKVEIQRSNSVQCRTFLLTLHLGGMLTASQVAEGLGLSKDRVRTLKKKLTQNDVQGLLDQRRGQQQDYRMTSQIKAELIQQFVLNTVTNAGTSSRQLQKDLEQRCQVELKDRTIRDHVAKLGLHTIGSSLRQLLDEVKKTKMPADTI